MKIIECKTNHLTSPLGYKMEKPVFSYIAADAKGKKQTAARIAVSCNKDMSGLFFDTGFTASIDSAGYEADIQLLPRTRYYWTVTVKSDAGEEAVSGINWFETGKMGEPWLAKWIACDSAEPRHPVFFKKLSVEKPVKHARLYICGLGLYEASINGKKIGNEELTPYCNDYNRWLQYQTFDVTDMIENGAEFSVLLGNGWYKGRFGYSAKLNRKPFFSDIWKLTAELRVIHDDGSETVTGTDEGWQIRRSNIVFSNIYDGEILDATLPEAEPEPAFVCPETIPVLTERLSVPVAVHERITTVDLIHTSAGETVLDMGQNFAGIFSLRVHEPNGTRVRLQFGEILQGGNFYRENLRSARAEYVYISDGNPCVVRPHFTFYGYRYVKVEGVSNLKKGDFEGLALYSDLGKTGSLSTGSDPVNKLIKNVEWGMKSNFIDIPTDCPQRDERMGWTGDAQVFSPTACYLRDSYAFFRKYLYDMAQEQETTGGKVPDVIPSVGNEGTSSVWGDAACIIPWNLYLFYGDKTILDRQYSSMKAWVDYITSVDGENNGWRDVYHYGDWLALDDPNGKKDATQGGTDKGFIASVYYAHSARLVVQAADVLGIKEDAATYNALAEKVMDGVRKEYYSATGRSCINTQTALVMALYFGVIGNRERVRAELRQKIERNDGKLQTGFVGTPLLCNVLSDNGMSDLAYRLLLNEEYPGWLYTVNLGATTIWERWNSVEADGRISSTGMNSLNHYAYGSIVEWLYRHAAGINPTVENPGFRKILLKPKPNYHLKFLKAEYRTPLGICKSAWNVPDDKHLELSFTIPFGSKAELHLPFAGEAVFNDKTNPLFTDVRDGVCYLGAGEYKVSYETNECLRQIVSTHNTIRELLVNRKAKALIEKMMPQIHQIPSSMLDFSMRQVMAKYGAADMVENMDLLDKTLAELE
jgi:alpha-L-rhamnosidase